MASTSDLTTRNFVKALAHKEGSTGTGVDALADQLVSAASDVMRTLTSRNLRAKTYTAELHDGDEAVGQGTKIYTQEYPVFTAPTVTENGLALTVATGYSTTAQVIAKLPDGILVRPAGWAPGVNNISITYSAGWTFPRSSDTAPLVSDLPFDIEQAVAKLAALMWAESPRIGEDRKSFDRWSVGYIQKLDPTLAAVIQNTSRGFRP